jgi:tripartite-type tricarboxylate transporter receptor subunit TctC
MTAEAMQHTLSSNVVVENRPGAGGVLANSMVAQSAPDGSMILVSGPSIAIQPQLFSSLPYDPITDLVSAGGVLQSPNVLVVKSDSSIQNLQSLIERARHQPELNYGSAGIATPGHLAMEYMNGTRGVRWMHIPYKGSSQALTDLLGGQLDFCSLSYTSVIEMAKSGKVRVIATLQPTRSKLLPDVSAISEAGFDHVDSRSRYALYVPAKTPRPVISRFVAAVQSMVTAKEKEKLFADMGYEHWPASPDEVDALMRSEAQWWAPVIKRLNLHVG